MNAAARVRIRNACSLGWVLTGLGLAGAGCGGAGSPGSPDVGPTEEWPPELTTSEGTGPALYLHEGPNAPAIGYISEGVRVRVAGTLKAGRAPVRIDGPLRVRGWLDAKRLAARVSRRGRVAGSPAYLGPNDTVGVRGPVRDGRIRVEVVPRFERADSPELGPFWGEFPADRLSAEEVDPTSAEPPTAGPSATLPEGTEVALYDRPDGEVVATLPALDPPLRVVVLREAGSWKGVRVGDGPYLVGHLKVALQPAAAAPDKSGVIGTAIQTGVVPERLQTEPERPLLRVAAKARISFDGRIIAVFREEGFAREMTRYDSGEVDVFAAVTDDLAVRGMLPANAVTPYDEQGSDASPATPPTPPADSTSSTSTESATPPAASASPGASSPERYTPGDS